MKSNFISKLAIRNKASNCTTSVAKEKESFTVSSLLVRGFSSRSQNLARLNVEKQPPEVFFKKGYS